MVLSDPAMNVIVLYSLSYCFLNNGTVIVKNARLRLTSTLSFYKKLLFLNRSRHLCHTLLLDNTLEELLIGSRDARNSARFQKKHSEGDDVFTSSNAPLHNFLSFNLLLCGVSIKKRLTSSPLCIFVYSQIVLSVRKLPSIACISFCNTFLLLKLNLCGVNL